MASNLPEESDKTLFSHLVHLCPLRKHVQTPSISSKHTVSRKLKRKCCHSLPEHGGEMPLFCRLASYGSTHANGTDFPGLFRLSVFSFWKSESTSETALGAVGTILDVQWSQFQIMCWSVAPFQQMGGGGLKQCSELYADLLLLRWVLLVNRLHGRWVAAVHSSKRTVENCFFRASFQSLHGWRTTGRIHSRWRSSFWNSRSCRHLALKVVNLSTPTSSRGNPRISPSQVFSSWLLWPSHTLLAAVSHLLQHLARLHSLHIAGKLCGFLAWSHVSNLQHCERIYSCPRFIRVLYCWTRWS